MLRVIAGQWKGLQLHTVKGKNVRPTTDRVKESMFNLIGPTLAELTVLDLFAGSGALGIEALSRGSKGAFFVDKNPNSLHVVRQNLERCDVQENAVVWRLDWQKAIARLAEANLELSWVFVDPPYAQNLWSPVLQALGENKLSIRCGIVCEHPKQVVLPTVTDDYEVFKDRTYGDIQLTLYRKRCGEEDDLQ